MERQTGRRPVELDGPELPSELAYIWSAFLDLSSSRGAGMAGPLPISYRDIKDYSDLMGIEFTPFEVEVIKAMDAAYLRASNG